MKNNFDELSAECSKLTTKKYSTSFSLGILFLHKSIRGAIYSIYGFVRFADEIVDSFNEYDKKYLLEKFKQDCYNAIEQKISLNPILNSFQKTI
ncbi:MAG: squalene/phytoene synthase family protein, partial [Sediminibacterium sp.]|nr:squalene/phytoene synthase family protein [Sediminibacterium sp.]